MESETIMYGVGASAAVVEYHVIKSVFPEARNTASALLGLAMLGANMMGVGGGSRFTPVLVGNGFTLLGITLVNALINPTVQSAGVRRVVNCPTCTPSGLGTFATEKGAYGTATPVY